MPNATEILKSKLSPKQFDLLTSPPVDIDAVWGTSGSGKSWIVNLKVYWYITTQIKDGSLCLVSGYTNETVYDNVIRELVKLDKGKGKIKFVGTMGHQRLLVPSKNIEIAVVGAANEGAEARIQGKSIDFWYADEVAKQPFSFVEMALGRLRSDTDEGMRTMPAVWTFNADRPAHWAKTQYLDKADGKSIRAWMFTYADNPRATPEFIAQQTSRYSGIYRARMIENKWTSAEGAVYCDFSRDKHVIERRPTDMVRRVLGIDWGWEHPLAILDIGIDGDGAYHIFDEIYAQHQQIDESLVELMKSKGWPIKQYEIAYADGARPEYIQRFGEITGIETIAANKDVHEGISDVSKALQTGQNGKVHLTVSPSCQHTITEFEVYEWLSGRSGTKDEPKKINDHAADCVRYVIHTNEMMTSFDNLGPIESG